MAMDMAMDLAMAIAKIKLFFHEGCQVQLQRLLLLITLLRNVGANFLRRGQLSKLAPFYKLAPKELPFSAYTKRKQGRNLKD